MKCEICGAEFAPRNSRQKTCGSLPCRKEYHRKYDKEYRRKYRERINEVNKRYMREHRLIREPKPDTIVAIGYAERQMAKTLESVGKVRTEL